MLEAAPEPYEKTLIVLPTMAFRFIVPSWMSKEVRFVYVAAVCCGPMRAASRSEGATFLSKSSVVSSTARRPSYFFVRPCLAACQPIAFAWQRSKACLTNLGPDPKWKMQKSLSSMTFEMPRLSMRPRWQPSRHS